MFYALWLRFEYESHSPVYFGKRLTDVFEFMRDTDTELYCDEVSLVEHDMNSAECRTLVEIGISWNYTNEEILNKLKKAYKNE